MPVLHGASRAAHARGPVRPSTEFRLAVSDLILSGAHLLLAGRGALPFAECWALVSRNSALADRCESAPGRRADPFLVDDSEPAVPRVIASYVAGRLRFAAVALYLSCPEIARPAHPLVAQITHASRPGNSRSSNGHLCVYEGYGARSGVSALSAW